EPGVRAAVHAGATSQDIIDTAMMLLARRALRVIEGDLAAAAGAAAGLARQRAGTVMAGRTLLQQAVPVTFGLGAAGCGPGWGVRRARGRRGGRPGRRWRRRSRPRSGWPSRCCPGTPTGSGW